MQSGHLQLEEINQRYGSFEALKQVSLEINSGEFVTLLGPSGSGKTTTLKIIAGFVMPDVGSVLLDGKDLTLVPPHQRDIGMVFQNYALFPHMTIAENIAFPLQMRKVARSEIGTKVETALEMVHLSGLGNRRPRELSGGQQQRVALARALVFRPRLLLMDEPLGALDRKLREAMQLEIVGISREIGITVVYVTHDQEEALAMSHRIAVYNDGRVEQVGTPEEVYQQPASLFVADFIGESTTFTGSLERRSGKLCLVSQRMVIPVSAGSCDRAGLAPGEAAALIVRPEAIRIRPAHAALPALDPAAIASLYGRLKNTVYLGTSRKHVVEMPGGVTALARTHTGDRQGSALQEDSEVELFWDISAGIVLPVTGAISRSEPVASTTTSPQTRSSMADIEDGRARTGRTLRSLTASS